MVVLWLLIVAYAVVGMPMLKRFWRWFDAQPEHRRSSILGPLIVAGLLAIGTGAGFVIQRTMSGDSAHTEIDTKRPRLRLEVHSAVVGEDGDTTIAALWVGVGNTGTPSPVHKVSVYLIDARKREHELVLQRYPNTDDPVIFEDRQRGTRIQWKSNQSFLGRGIERLETGDMMNGFLVGRTRQITAMAAVGIQVTVNDVFENTSEATAELPRGRGVLVRPFSK